MNEAAHDGQDEIIHRPSSPWEWLIVVVLPASAVAYSFNLTSFIDAKDAVLAAGLVFCGALLWRGHFDLSGFRYFLPLWLLLAWGVAVGTYVGGGAPSPFVLRAATHYALVLLFTCMVMGGAGPALRNASLIGTMFAGVLVGLLGYVQFFRLAPEWFPEFQEYPQRVYSVFGNQDLFGGFLALVLPVAAWGSLRSNRPAPFAGLILFLLPILILSSSRSAWLAAVAGVGVVFVLHGRVDRRISTLAGTAAFIVVITFVLQPTRTWDRVLSALGAHDPGVAGRILFMRSGAAVAGEHPLTGVGLGNFRSFEPEHEGRFLRASDGHPGFYSETPTLHAHNDVLELAAETGLVGFGLLVAAAWRVPRRRTVEWAVLAAFGVFALLNPVVRSAPHLLVALLAAGSLCSSDPAVVSEASSAWRRAGIRVACVGMAAATLLVIVIPSYRLETWGRDDAAEYYKARLADHPWPEAWEEAGWFALEDREYEEAERLGTRAARYLDTGRVHLLLALAAAAQGDGERASESARDCLDRWPGNGRAWELYLRSLPPTERKRALDERNLWLGRESVPVIP